MIYIIRPGLVLASFTGWTPPLPAIRVAPVLTRAANFSLLSGSFCGHHLADGHGLALAGLQLFIQRGLLLAQLGQPPGVLKSSGQTLLQVGHPFRAFGFRLRGGGEFFIHAPQLVFQ